MKRLLTASIVLLFMLGIAVVSYADEDDWPGMAGPVPSFIHHRLERVINEQVFAKVAYPEFGIPAIDRELLAFAHKEFKENYGDLGDDPQDADLKSKFSMSYSLSSSRHPYLSVRFGVWHDMGGPHPHLYHYISTYNLTTGQPVRYQDIFPKWEATKQERIALAKQTAQESECSLELYGNSFDDEPLGFTFSPEGLTVLFFGTYNSADWQCMELHFDKDELIEIGADPKYWD